MALSETNKTWRSMRCSPRRSQRRRQGLAPNFGGPSRTGVYSAAPSRMYSLREKSADRSAKQHLDWQPFVFVFVGWGLPLKMIRMHPPKTAYDFDTGLEWTKRIAINYVQLGPATEFAVELVKSWLEEHF